MKYYVIYIINFNLGLILKHITVNNISYAVNIVDDTSSYLSHGYFYKYEEESLFEKRIKKINQLNKISNNFKTTENKNFNMVSFRFH